MLLPRSTRNPLEPFGSSQAATESTMDDNFDLTNETFNYLSNNVANCNYFNVDSRELNVDTSLVEC